MEDTKHFRVAALGASEGGLEAFRTLLSSLPPDSGMAFILVQHLDPQHVSFMVSLLASHTQMTVSEAGERTHLEPNQVYINPSGCYLTVSDGELRLSPVGGGGRARMPFDVLLESSADAYGERAACVVLSGTGSDGSIGAQAIRLKGGLTIAQDPSEAEFDGMPRSAIATGAIGFVLPLERVARALVDFAKSGLIPTDVAMGAFPANSSYAKIIDLLRQKSAHDFDLHKRGTLMRRIQRRMALANIEDPAVYMKLLETDPDEVRNLIDDLFIIVTSFFRDASAFELLKTQILPDILHTLPYNQSFRAWVAGCSTGEEAYSIAMSFTRSSMNSAEADGSAPRLARLFLKEDQGFCRTGRRRHARLRVLQWRDEHRAMLSPARRFPFRPPPADAGHRSTRRPRFLLQRNPSQCHRGGDRSGACILAQHQCHQ
ncbi:MAG TPA: chemotaxis protein CheB [Methylocella sp.]|nr:chemotaxis protein CheB [Methylocella sp.]